MQALNAVARGRGYANWQALRPALGQTTPAPTPPAGHPWHLSARTGAVIALGTAADQPLPWKGTHLTWQPGAADFRLGVLDDLHGPGADQAARLATLLLPPRSGGAEFYRHAERLLLTELITHVSARQGTWQDLLRILCGGADAITGALRAAGADSGDRSPVLKIDPITLNAMSVAVENVTRFGAVIHEPGGAPTLGQTLRPGTLIRVHLPESVTPLGGWAAHLCAQALRRAGPGGLLDLGDLTHLPALSAADLLDLTDAGVAVRACVPDRAQARAHYGAAAWETFTRHLRGHVDLTGLG